MLAPPPSPEQRSRLTTIAEPCIDAGRVLTSSGRSLPPRRHAPEHAVAPDQAVEKRGAEMREEGREEQIGEDSVEVAEPSIERQIMRQDRRQPQRPVEYDRIARRREHAPADQRHDEHERIQYDMRCLRG